MCVVRFGLKKEWCDLRNRRPGQRFQGRYERNRRSRTNKLWARRFFQPVVGTILFAAGIVFCFIPGPGLPLLIVGAALLAERSRTLARAMDWSEVKLRELISRGMAWWRQASVLAKDAIIVLAAFAIATAGYGAYHIFFER